MQSIRPYTRGFATGFLFGTVGIFVLALLSLMHPLFEIVAWPFLWPGRTLSTVIAGSSASTPMVLLLYILTGLFYGIAGAGMQYFVRSSRMQIR